MRQFHKGDVVRYMPTSFAAMHGWAGERLPNYRTLPTPGSVGVVKFEPFGSGPLAVEIPFYGLYQIAPVDLEWVGHAEAG